MHRVPGTNTANCTGGSWEKKEGVSNPEYQGLFFVGWRQVRSTSVTGKILPLLAGSTLGFNVMAKIHAYVR